MDAATGAAAAFMKDEDVLEISKAAVLISFTGGSSRPESNATVNEDRAWRLH